MPNDYLLSLEERAAKLWGVISQLEAKRIAALEAFALNDDQESKRVAERYGERIIAANEALEAVASAIEIEEDSRA